VTTTVNSGALADARRSSTPANIENADNNAMGIVKRKKSRMGQNVNKRI